MERGDARRIRQILINLVSNAVKFTAIGQVGLSVRLVQQSEGRTVLQFRVRDTGIGIARERQAAIFERYAQADSSTSRLRGGIGLGLTISRSLARLMGGTIGLESELGEGSVFWLELTLASLPGEPVSRGLGVTSSGRGSADTETPAPGLAGLRMLLVEDDPTNRRVALRLLERVGCHADSVSDGREALEMLERSAYDAVLMDVRMDGMDGHATTAEIRRRERDTGRRLPVIAMTAGTMRHDRERCLAAGMDDILSKPLTEGRLAEVLLRSALRSGDADPREEPLRSCPLAVPAVLRIERLCEVAHGEVAFERNLLEGLLADAAGSLDEIGAAFRAGDAAGVAAVAHGLLGACRTVGADALAGLCHDLEQALRTSGLPDERRTVKALYRAYDNLREAAQAQLQGREVVSR